MYKPEVAVGELLKDPRRVLASDDASLDVDIFLKQQKQSQIF
jgi:hypothetical protein